MKLKICISLVGLAVLVLAHAQAQTLPAPLVQAVRTAVASNPEVQARWNGFLAAESERDAAMGAYRPQVDLTAGVGVEARSTPASDSSSYGINGQKISLQQMLFDGGLTNSEVKRLGYARLARYYELAEVSESVALEAVRAYADVVRYRELVQAASDNYVIHKQSATLVQERAKGGVGRGVDVEQATGRLALAESNLLTELANLHDVSARFQRIVGEVPAGRLPGLPEGFSLGALPKNTDTLFRDGLQGSPVLNAALERVRAAKQSIESRKSAFLPRLDVQASASHDSNSGGVSGSTLVSNLQLALNFNAYRGGADVARERQAVGQKDEARDLQEKACRDVRNTLSVAFKDVRVLSDQQKYLDQHRLSTEKSLEAYRQQFEIGQRTLLDLLDSQNEFFEASRSYINTRHNQIVAQARTLSGMGRLVSVMGVNRADVPDAKGAGQDRDGVDPADLCPLTESVIDTLEAIKADLMANLPPPMPKASNAAAPCDRVTLLPEADGKVGVMVIRDGKGGEVVLDKAYGSSVNDCDRVSFQQSSAAEVNARYKIVTDALPAPVAYYRVNFVVGTTKLLPESKGALLAMVEDFRKRPAPEVTIVGHTDKLGNTASNRELSRRRALEIQRVLVGEGGVKLEEISTAWRGDLDPLPGTEGKRIEPRNRRVEVKLK
ncbi:MAG: hypothetical protein RLZZ591_2163 [Pseudomonadota bacterium]|jgi:adhesin transport system outer membrane protein